MEGSMDLLSVFPAKYLEFADDQFAASQATIRLQNETDYAVAFKIKTTAPRRYLVRPSVGVVAAHETQTIQVLNSPRPQPSADDRGLDKPSNDKFLVQAAYLPSNSNTDAEALRNFWAAIPKNEIQEHKMHVVTLGPEQARLKELQSANTQNAGGAPSLPTPGEESAASISGRGTVTGDESYHQLKSAYDELVQYTLVVEKDKVRLERQVDELMKKAELGKGNGGGVLWFLPKLELWHIPIMLLCAMLCYWFLQR
eukprot:GHVT01070364.1.p1 GENE.GHVT01070364.1~~GHVT01070364.1.p1  ORF type:complete len:255 (+),score=40.38 GHVT01070364.1:311-1075(+)